MSKLRYGVVSPEWTKTSHHSAVITAAVVLKAKSGRWMTMSSDEAILTTATTNGIDGYCNEIDLVVASGAKYPLMTSMELVVEMPYWNGTSVATSILTAAILKGVMYQACDIYVASNVQYADLSASTYDVLVIVGGDIGKNVLYCKRNPYPANRWPTGVV